MDAAMNQPSKMDRRRTKRRSLSYYILIQDATTQETIGHLVDISPIGLMLDSPKPLPLEKDLRLRLDTNPDVADKPYITFVARAKWCKPDTIDTTLYDIGFSIVNISPHDAEIVARIAEKYASQGGFTFPAK
jgi:hypothetical protein